MLKTALFPGSFDPITRGHQDIVLKGLSLFDKIIIAIGKNTKKPGLFSIEQRKLWIQETFNDDPHIEVLSYEGLTVNFCKEVGAKFILRGLRSPGDFEYEQHIAYANKALVPEIETVFLLSSAANNTVSSTIVREVIINRGNYQLFMPEGIAIDLSLLGD
jgi:pantetheine-phosphate adenylyltransferase